MAFPSGCVHLEQPFPRVLGTRKPELPAWLNSTSCKSRQGLGQPGGVSPRSPQVETLGPLRVLRSDFFTLPPPRRAAGGDRSAILQVSEVVASPPDCGVFKAGDHEIQVRGSPGIRCARHSSGLCPKDALCTLARPHRRTPGGSMSSKRGPGATPEARSLPPELTWTADPASQPLPWCFFHQQLAI